MIAALALLDKVLSVAALTPELATQAQAIWSAIKGGTVTPEQLTALEKQTNDLMAQIAADAAE